MGTASYLLLGTREGLNTSFCSTCHGAGRAMSRSKAKSIIKKDDLLSDLRKKNIILKIGNEAAAVEEAPECYKDIDDVVNVCERSKISLKCVKFAPVGVLKG